MHRLSEYEHEVVLTMLRVLREAWNHANDTADVHVRYNVRPSPLLSDLHTFDDWSKALAKIIPTINIQSLPPSETPAERQQDLELIYERLNLTPPTE
jgi:hypothetical protein